VGEPVDQGNGIESVTVRDPEALASSDRRFIRLVVSLAR